MAIRIPLVLDEFGNISELPLGDSLISDVYRRQSFELDSSDIFNGYVLLDESMNSLRVDESYIVLDSGPAQFSPNDWEVVETVPGNGEYKQISWVGKLLDGILTAGDIIKVVFVRRTS